MTWNIQVPDHVRKQADSSNKPRRTYTELPQNAGQIISAESVKNAPSYRLTSNELQAVAAEIKRLNSSLIGIQRPYEWLRLHGADGGPSQHDRFVGYIEDHTQTVGRSFRRLAKYNPLTSYQLTSRLSHFLWMPMPDEKLLSRAADGSILNEDILVQRMLAVPVARRITFPEFDTQLNSAMQQEVILVFEHLLQPDGSLVRLLNSRDTFLNERLAQHYNIAEVHGDNFRLAKLPDDRRGGLTGRAAVLTATSTPTRTSPVLRRKWILETLAGESAGEPPPDAGTTTGTTLREKLAMHRRNPSCAACHDKIDQIDPLGFVLENFDALGRYREQINGTPIDATATLPDGTQFDGPASLRRHLTENRQSKFIENLTRRLLNFALGRQLQRYDKPTVRQVVDAVHEHDNSATALVQQIVLSLPFRHQSQLTDDEVFSQAAK